MALEIQPATDLLPDGLSFVSDRAAGVAHQLVAARNYTMTLLDGLDDEAWFWVPEPAVTHIAWQVGHLAFGQYGLVLFRQRGRLREDAQLMSGSFRKTFAKGTTPSSDPADYPSVAAILATLDAVFQQSLTELGAMQDEGLDDPLEPPWSVYPTRYGALLFAVHHELLHAGQIGLLRRLMGRPPLR